MGRFKIEGSSIVCRHLSELAPACRGTSGAGARPKGVWEIMDSLRDISPDDLFPGVAYSISEDDGDEDMPYTRPVRPTQKNKDIGNDSTERRRSEGV